jgi:hypothetical protein
MLHVAVFGVSFATLAFEVLLARLFAISQWHHLSFMVISIALFGFAASGSFLSVADLSRWVAPGRSPPAAPLAGLSLLCSAAMMMAYCGLVHLPLDYFRLALEPVQLLYLLAVYLLLILPFFFAGGVIALAYVVRPQHPGPVYAASMAGSALGAMLPAALLEITGEVAMVGLAALAPAGAAAAGLLACLRPESGGRRRGWTAAMVAAWLLVCAAAIGLLTPAAQTRLAMGASEYKLLSQVLQFPDTRVVESVTGIRGRIERVQSPHQRFAPGLSLKYTDPLPPAEALYTDRDQPLFLYDLRSAGGADFARFSLSFSGYEIVGAPDRVLLVMAAGGLAVACARASGAREVRILKSDPHLAAMIQRHYEVDVVRENARAYLARGGPGAFDVIHIESWGASLPGADALNQDHLLTVEGLAECLRSLTPQGALIVSRKLLLPPANTLRVWSTARAALVRLGQEAPDRCLAVLRNWDTFTLVATPRPIRDSQRLLEFARRLNFDVVYLQGAVPADANRFNVFDAPYHFGATQELAAAFSSGTPGDFFASYLLDVRPRGDLQPFPGRFLKWNRLDDLYRSFGSRMHTLFLAGEVIVAVVFVQALAIVGVLLLIPAAAAARRAKAGGPSHVAYFLGIGFGFILAELLFVHAGTFFFGDPVVSLAFVLAVLLVTSGMGALWSQRLGPRWIRPALLAAAASLLMVSVALWIFARPLLALPETWRGALLAAGLLVPGVAMGMPFPLGMRFLLRRPAERSFAWAANGCASVLASIAAAQIAVSAGLHGILCAAIVGYFLAAWGIRKKPREIS